MENLKDDEDRMTSDKDEWSEVDDKLIALVKLYPVIYTKHNNKSSKIEKLIRKCWKAIGKELDKNPENCRRRWRRIQLTYLKERRKNKDIVVMTEPQKPSKYNQIYLNGKLNFLDLEIDVDCKPESSPDDSDVQMNENCRPESLSDDTDVQIDEDCKPEPSSDDTDLQIDENCNPEPSSDNLIVQIDDDCKSKSSSEDSDVQIKKLHEHNYGSKGYITAGDWEKFCNRIDTLSSEHSNSSGIEMNNSIPNYNEGTTEIFFQKMASYVGSRLTPEEQTEIRLKICSLLTKAELQFLEKLGK